MSFHASSRLILHAEVSYIIDIACHWSFFSNITSFSYFLDRQNPDFFPFSNSQFLRTGTHRTYVHQFDLDYWAKTRYQPIFRHCLGAVFNKIGDVSDPETEKQMLVTCAWVCAIVSRRHEYLMSSKTGKGSELLDCYAASSLSITWQLNAKLFILCCLSFSQSKVVYVRESHITS